MADHQNEANKSPSIMALLASERQTMPHLTFYKIWIFKISPIDGVCIILRSASWTSQKAMLYI